MSIIETVIGLIVLLLSCFIVTILYNVGYVGYVGYIVYFDMKHSRSPDFSYERSFAPYTLHYTLHPTFWDISWF